MSRPFHTAKVSGIKVVCKQMFVLFSSAWDLKSHFTGLNLCHREFDMNMHKAGMLRFVIDLQLEKQQQSSRSEPRKRYSSQKNVKNIILDV